MKNLGRFLLIPLVPLLISACAVVGSNGSGINYTMSNIAYKVINSPADKVGEAVRKALKGMDITFIDESKIETGRRIKAATAKYTVFIDLEEITSKTTKLYVDVQESALVKDSGVEVEIIKQTEAALGIR